MQAKWEKTHRYAGPLFLAGGALMVLNGLLFSGGTITVVMLSIIAVISIIPIVYAYRLEDEEPSDFV
nr:SdpI family protein [Neolewinella agarilytica]